MRGAAKRLVCAAMIAASVFAGVAGTSGQARAATASSGPYVRDSATCQAFRVFERHPGSKRFRVMLADSRSSLHYLRIDVAWWNVDRERHASAAGIGTDVAFVRLDCTDYAAQADS